MIGRICIQDLEVFGRIGVPAPERAQPQRLLITIELELDFSPAASSDDLSATIDYQALSRRIVDYLSKGEWRLLEKLTSDLASLLWKEFPAKKLAVRIKKFALPQAQFVMGEVVLP